MPAPMISVYALTKAAVKMITRTAAVEMAPIRVNAVAPGSIETPIYDRHFLDDDGKVDPERQRNHFDTIAQMNPLGFVGNPNDIAYAILYLCSDAGRFVTGPDHAAQRRRGDAAVVRTTQFPSRSLWP